MNRKTLRKCYFWMAIISATLFLSSCEVEQVEFVDISSVAVTDMKGDEMFLDVTAIFDNPNSFNIKVVDSDLDLFLDGNNMGKAALVEGFTLEGGTQKAYDLKVKAQGNNLQMKMLPIMLTAALTGKVTVKLQGDITGRVSMIKKKVNVDITEDVKFRKES